MTTPHPSALALDLHALGNDSTAVNQHVLDCAQCRAQVEASKPAHGTVPVWVPRTPPRPRFQWRWPVFATVCAASLTVWVMMAPTSKGSATEVTRAKGQPSFALYVEHGGHIRLWDGQSPVAAGDRLQLKVSAEGFTHLSVGLAETTGWKTIFQGVVSPSGETALPQSFEVDADTTTLRLGLLWCDPQCPSDAVPTAVQNSPRNDKQWWSSFELRRKDE